MLSKSAITEKHPFFRPGVKTGVEEQAGLFSGEIKPQLHGNQEIKG